MPARDLADLPVRLDGDDFVLVETGERLPIERIEAMSFDQARARSAFVVFTFALLIGPVCGGGAFIIHWFLGIVFAFLPILVGLVILTWGAVRKPRFVLTVDGEERVWLLPRDIDFEAVQAVSDAVEQRVRPPADESLG